MSRAHEVLSYVGLDDARYREVETYSTGMRARVKLAQALVADPDLLLLDEPTNGLDPQGRADMLWLIRDVAARLGIHVVLSSHLLPDVEAVCSHVIVVNAGRVVVDAPIRELKELREKRWEIEVRGNEDAFRHALGPDVRIVEDRGAELLAQVPDESGTEPILRAAASSGTELRRLALRERTLAEIFVAAVRPVPGGGR